MKLPYGDQGHFLDTLRDGALVYGQNLRLIFYNASYLALYDLSENDLTVGEHLEQTLRTHALKGKLGAPDGEPVEETVARRMARWGREEARLGSSAGRWRTAG